MRRLAKIVTAVALSAIAVTAHAATKIYVTRTGNFITAAPVIPVPLDQVGGTIRSFNLASAKKLYLTYSAECAVGSPNPSAISYVDLDIIVNGIVVGPTVGTADAFCTSNHTPPADGWVRSSITVHIQGIAGTNSVRIIAKLQNGAIPMHLGDTALLVFESQ